VKQYKKTAAVQFIRTAAVFLFFVEYLQTST